MRLIDVDKLHYISKWFEDSNKSEVVVFAKEIDKAPTVDAVPVIRCKDCKYKEYGYCNIYLSFHHLTADMDYCSDAERKEEND